jgi:hypothetical protein
MVHRTTSVLAVVVIAGSGCGRIHFDPSSIAADGVTPRSELVLGTAPGEPLDDFPLMVVLDDTRAARDLMLPDASDLRFFDASGNVLAHEIEQVGSPGGPPLVAWVRVPRIEGTTTRIIVDYGHGTAVPPSTASAWAPPYQAVWHFADLHDSTENHHDGVWRGTGVPPAAQGMCGPTLRFVPATGDAIEVMDRPNLGLTTLTISGWLDPTTLVSPSGYVAIVSRENGATTDDDFWLGANGTTPLGSVSTAGAKQFAVTSAAAIPLDQWTHLVITYDGLVEWLYFDGAAASTASTPGPVLHDSHPIFIGADRNVQGSPAPDADFVSGRVDEIRLESVVRSPAWLAYDDKSMRDQLIRYGPVMR